MLPPKIIERLQSFSVPRGTAEKLEHYAELYFRWQSTINLAKSDNFWERHMMDSLQLLPFLPSSLFTLADIGSGAGFPGMVIGLSTLGHIHLIESDIRKCAFLREVIRINTCDNITIHNARVENVLLSKCDVLTARACAPLAQLLSITAHLWSDGTYGLFLKGKSWPEEVAQAQRSWHFSYQSIPSITDSQAMLLQIKDPKRI